MSRLLWCTDIHLDHLRVPDAARMFGDYLRQKHNFDAVVVTGDIAEAGNVAGLLGQFADGITTGFWLYVAIRIALACTITQLTFEC